MPAQKQLAHPLFSSYSDPLEMLWTLCVNMVHLISVDCKWGEWSSCTRWCGEGQRIRSYLVRESHGGKKCSGSTTKHCSDYSSNKNFT